MLLLRWFLNAVALIMVSYIVPGFHVSSIYAALIAAVILGLINATIRPILLILTLPVTIVTLGLFTLVINALMILLASSIVKGFSVDSFGAALIGGLVLWLISFATNTLLLATKE